MSRSPRNIRHSNTLGSFNCRLIEECYLPEAPEENGKLVRIRGAHIRCTSLGSRGVVVEAAPDTVCRLRRIALSRGWTYNEGTPPLLLISVLRPAICHAMHVHVACGLAMATSDGDFASFPSCRWKVG